VMLIKPGRPAWVPLTITLEQRSEAADLYAALLRARSLSIGALPAWESGHVADRILKWLHDEGVRLGDQS
jgi:hypothetical protein